jgi:glycosyltransferase 2 family protein
MTKKYISYLLRFAVAGAALYLAFRGENIKQVSEVLWGLNLWVFVAAVGIYILSQLIFVARWSLLMRVQSIKIGYWPAVRLHFLGLFYNNCLPSSVGGDFLRAWYVTKHTDMKIQAALSVFVDRAVGLTGIFFMAIGGYMFWPAQSKQGDSSSQFNDIHIFQGLTEHKGLLLGVFLAFVIIVAVFLATKKGRTLYKHYMTIVCSKGKKLIHHIYEAIRIYWNKKSALFLALLLTFACQGLFIIGLWLIGREIGIDAQMKYYMIFFPISWLLGTLPISVGGAGIMELWLKAMFIEVCGVSSENALVLALSQRIIWLIGSLPGVVIHLIGAHLPKDFSIDYNEHVA